MDNANSPEYLEKIKNQVIENLKRTTFAPSVQMTDVPRDPEGMDDEADAILDDEDEDENKDQRTTKRQWDKYVEKDGELSESEDEEENQRNGIRQQSSAQKRRNMMDYQNPDAVSDDEEQLGVSGRARSRDSEKVNGAHADITTNGSGLYESSTPSPAPSHASPGAEDTTMHDADTDMADEVEPILAPPIQLVAEGPQEATPPDSPPADITNLEAIVVHDPASSTPAEDDDAMVDEPEAAHENGLAEREREDVTAEMVTEVVQNQEQT